LNIDGERSSGKRPDCGDRRSGGVYGLAWAKLIKGASFRVDGGQFIAIQRQARRREPNLPARPDLERDAKKAGADFSRISRSKILESITFYDFGLIQSKIIVI
jgi:hypothetical protein